ncbi:trimeric intracellular cation channel family protein [Pseudoalteromonas sp. G4]|uniref:trimeric intracellular cation channel family protein n=1 Tax=Pseudoalteromonas sp. G4 TaxID=2992761 RepID=UPI00237ED100|nr:trimeric intracellular cation channel family protein [Pseudoalteromonas sp. G4]MDE3272468.1 trimeric intracellular cation channel family protein [Pseudoalteromonas sp. G4]
MDSLFHWIDLVGVAVFAISGALVAYKKKLDGFGVIVLASVTAIGGGTTRDVILDVPVFWLKDPTYLISIFIASAITIVWLNRQRGFPQVLLEIADALGLAFFVVMGVQKALSLGMPDLTAIVMGTITGCFGGMIRDVLARTTPMVLKSELYATTCIFGGILYTQSLNLGLSANFAMILGMLGTLGLRAGAIKWGWSLHVFKYSKIDK